MGDNYITFLFERELYYLNNDNYTLVTKDLDDMEIEFSCSEDMKESFHIEEYDSTVVIDECRYNENGMYLHIIFNNKSTYNSASLVALEILNEDYKIPVTLDINVKEKEIGNLYSQADLITNGGHDPYENGVLEYTLLFMGVPSSIERKTYTLEIKEIVVNTFTKK